ncbi:MAG: hypothetical protein AAGA30_04040 [Planctomycetota bacterium]
MNVTDSTSGGLFAKFLYVRMEATPEAVETYREKIPSGKRLNQPGGMMILSEDLPDEEMYKLFEQDTQFEYHDSDDSFVPWWKIELIQNGTFHYQEFPNACGYKIYIDDDESVVYVYWHHS